jgi:HK97 gp10 family phage protein
MEGMKIDVETHLKVEEVEAKVQSAVEEGLKKTVYSIESDAKKLSPVDTGRNRSSIASEVEGLSGQIYGASGYSAYLEFGTVKMAARPYFQPALDMHAKELPENIRASLGKGE